MRVPCCRIGAAAGWAIEVVDEERAKYPRSAAGRRSTLIRPVWGHTVYRDAWVEARWRFVGLCERPGCGAAAFVREAPICWSPVGRERSCGVSTGQLAPAGLTGSRRGQVDRSPRFVAEAARAVCSCRAAGPWETAPIVDQDPRSALPTAACGQWPTTCTRQRSRLPDDDALPLGDLRITGSGERFSRRREPWLLAGFSGHGFKFAREACGSQRHREPGGRPPRPGDATFGPSPPIPGPPHPPAP